MRMMGGMDGVDEVMFDLGLYVILWLYGKKPSAKGFDFPGWRNSTTSHTNSKDSYSGN